MNICKLWLNQVMMSPERIALVDNQNKYTYNNINIWSDYISSQLIKKCECSGKVIGLFFSNSIEYIVAALAVLKVGAAFVPLDIMWPLERIQYVVEDCHAVGVINGDKYYSEKKDIFLLDMMPFSSIDASSPFINTDIAENCLAYILYTSGTTGTPKGVMIEHRSVVNMIRDFNEHYCINENRNAIQLSPISFDVSINEIFATLLNGGTLFVPDKTLKTHRKAFYDYMVFNAINILQCTPSLLNELVVKNYHIPSLKVVISGGEPLSESTKTGLLQKGYRVYNHYGPTECTVYSTRQECSDYAPVTIGTSISNVHCYIIDSEENIITQKNVKGELCISGVNVARGYCGDEELTNRKFGKLKNERLYRTGDIVSWNESEELEFWGRVDNQVKIRGNRVEIGEIEKNVLACCQVSQCCVIYSNDKCYDELVLFYTSKNDITELQIKDELGLRIPKYMIPNRIIRMETMPYTEHGKVDRKALLANMKERSVSFMQETELDDMQLFCEISSLINKALENDIIIAPNSKLCDIGLNSLNYISLIVELEDKYGIFFDYDELTSQRIDTVFDLQRMVDEKIHQ